MREPDARISLSSNRVLIGQKNCLLRMRALVHLVEPLPGWLLTNLLFVNPSLISHYSRRRKLAGPLSNHTPTALKLRQSFELIEQSNYPNS